MTDSLLKGGRAIDPSQGLDARMDVAVQDGAISEIAPNIRPGPDTRVIKADGKLVTPGLIDLHTRVYHGVNQTGVDPDLAGVRAGVTTVVDAGSAGYCAFGGFPRTRRAEGEDANHPHAPHIPNRPKLSAGDFGARRYRFR